jgi:hypothetical protein
MRIELFVVNIKNKFNIQNENCFNYYLIIRRTDSVPLTLNVLMSRYPKIHDNRFLIHLTNINKYLKKLCLNLWKV